MSELPVAKIDNFPIEVLVINQNVYNIMKFGIAAYCASDNLFRMIQFCVAQNIVRSDIINSDAGISLGIHRDVGVRNRGDVIPGFVKTGHQHLHEVIT
ncbi:hypothetical protein D3C75_645550 [compost metagenome]